MIVDKSFGKNLGNIFFPTTVILAFILFSHVRRMNVFYSLMAVYSEQKEMGREVGLVLYLGPRGSKFICILSMQFSVRQTFSVFVRYILVPLAGWVIRK